MDEQGSSSTPQCPGCRERDREIADLKFRLEKAEQRIQELSSKLDEALRAQKRQAAPFSKGAPKKDPKRPGRKPGAAYGRVAHRRRPSRVDQRINVPLPPHCACGGRPVEEGSEPQWQVDVPKVQPQVTRFDLHVGHCARCGRRLQGRHPLQTSDALGAAAVQIGPNALALAAHLNKRAGMSYEKIQDFFGVAFSLSVSRSTLVRGLLRLSDKARPTYEGLIVLIRRAKALYSDETGWKVGGFRRWLWVHVSLLIRVCVYRITRGRGYEDAAEVLGEDFSGLLGTDGWAPYDRFLKALRQTCLAHLLRRCHELEEVFTRGAIKFPRAVKALLQKALVLRDRRDAGDISSHGLAVAKGRLEAAVSRLADGRFTNDLNRKLAQHLHRLHPQLFTFLTRTGVEATNWPAEQALRPAVVNRKMSAGNRTDRGARAQETLMSILQTCRLQGQDAIDLFVRMLRSPTRRAHQLVHIRSG